MLQQMLSNRHPIDKELNALKEKTLGLERGALVKHRDIEEWTGLTKDKTPWQKLIKHWKKWMIESRQIHLISEPGVGYRLPTVDEQIFSAVRYEKQSARRIHKATVVAGVIPTDQLSPAGQSFQHAIVNDGREIRALMKEKSAERKSLLSQQPTLPRLGAA